MPKWVNSLACILSDCCWKLQLSSCFFILMKCNLEFYLIIAIKILMLVDRHVYVYHCCIIFDSACCRNSPRKVWVVRYLNKIKLYIDIRAELMLPNCAATRDVSGIFKWTLSENVQGKLICCQRFVSSIRVSWRDMSFQVVLNNPWRLSLWASEMCEIALLVGRSKLYARIT